MDDHLTLAGELADGQRVWKAPGETKDALVRFQRDVVLPLRRIAQERGLRLSERRESFRGATFVVRVEIKSEGAAKGAGSRQRLP